MGSIISDHVCQLISTCVTPREIQERDEFSNPGKPTSGGSAQRRCSGNAFGALWSMTPLLEAAGQGNTAAVEALLEAGARPDAGWTLLFGLLPVQTPLNRAANEATKTALRAAVARAAGDKEL